ncbi:acetyl-CoA carboxylase biotin carboxyl carrier protein subunit [uncultured Paracoccus sp.]|uniref:acetyl-CoA carboxylase biotin carboxyl carrier protein n=1 Tax=uncultured Paracoccus sp. TaxID=189685 RepID=UPI0025CD1E02|nr:acetyl-CoA carboxylase biotin carboxyl carrier protein subunit [uncultured Paracoccus sp.]
MPITIQAIIAQIERAALGQLAEYTTCVDGQRITIKRALAEGAAPPPPPVQTTPLPESPDAAVRAPLGGLCHLRPEPGEAPFVQPGDQVAPGQTICLIEAMKMMTPIPAETGGTIEAVLVADGETIAAGTPLMRVRP